MVRNQWGKSAFPCAFSFVIGIAQIKQLGAEKSALNGCAFKDLFDSGTNVNRLQV